MKTILKLLVVTTLFISTSLFAANPIRLVIGQPFSYAVSGMSWSQSYIYVHVENVGTDASRRVYINYNLNNSGVWQRDELSLQDNYGTHSLYSTVLSAPTVEFAVEIQSSEGSDWDNNDGSNYKIQPWFASGDFVHGTVGGKVGLKSALNEAHVVFTKFGAPYIVDYDLTGEIYVENLGYDKEVGIVVNYGDGNWHWVNATYSHSLSTGGSDNIEVWEFLHEYYGHPNSSDWQFAVFYHNLDTDEWYWDNNFEQDYFVGKNDGASIN